MAYYRHYVERRTHEPIGGGFRFTELEPDEYIRKEEKERMAYCEGYSSKDRPMIWLTIKFTHEISKEDYEKRNIYTIPIKQIIFYPI